MVPPRKYRLVALVFCCCFSAPVFADSPACHMVATDPREADKQYKATAHKDLDGLTVIAACKKAVDQNPSDGRLQYQLARGYSATGLTKETLVHLKRGADAGYAHAQIDLYNWVNAKRPGISLTDAEMASLLVHASAQGQLQARFALARAYFSGTYVTKNVAQAAKLMKPLAEQGFPDAMRDYGQLIATGLVEGEDASGANVWLEKAIKAGDPEAMTIVGKAIHSKGDVDQAFKLFMAAAERGHAEGAYLVSVILIKTRKKEYRPDSLRYLKQASDAGFIQANHDYAVLILKGDVTSEKPTTAVQLLEKAAMAGHGQAKGALFKIYFEGTRGIPADVAKGKQFMNKLVAAGDTNAMIELGDYFLSKEKNKASAERLFKQAADAGNSSAYGKLVKLYMQESYNYKAAAPWIEKDLQAGSMAGLKLATTRAKYHKKYNDFSDILTIARRVADPKQLWNIYKEMFTYGGYSKFWFEKQKLANHIVRKHERGAGLVAQNYVSTLKSYVRGRLFGRKEYYPDQISSQLADLKKLLNNRYNLTSYVRKDVTDIIQKVEPVLKKHKSEFKEHQALLKKEQAQTAIYRKGHRQYCGDLPPLPADRAKSKEINASNKRKNAWRTCMNKLYKTLWNLPSPDGYAYQFTKTTVGYEFNWVGKPINDVRSALINSIHNDIKLIENRTIARNKRIK